MLEDGIDRHEMARRRIDIAIRVGLVLDSQQAVGLGRRHVRWLKRRRRGPAGSDAALTAGDDRGARYDEDGCDGEWRPHDTTAPPATRDPCVRDTFQRIH